MTGCYAIIVITACGIGLLAIWAADIARRAVAASLVGEIAEFVRVIERQLPAEGGTANTSVVLQSQSLPWSPVIYQAHSGRVGLLGVHRARLIASFYASLQSLNEELRGHGVARSPSGSPVQSNSISAKLRTTLDLGDEALRSLRPIVSRPRDGSLRRA